MNKTIDDVYKELLDAQERLRFDSLRRHGIITDAVIILNPKHKGVMEEVLYNVGIHAMPIIYSNCVEENKMYFSTDTDFMTMLKLSLEWKGE